MSLARLSRVALKAGARPPSGPLWVDLSPVTIFVGPNNGGKSTALADLAQYAGRGGGSPVQPWAGGTVIGQVEMPPPTTQQEAIDFLKPRTHEVTEHHVSIRAFSPEPQTVPGGSGVQTLGLHDLDPMAYGGDAVAAKLLAPYTISLNGRQRFDLAAGRPSGPLDGPPTSHWMAVERDDSVYDEVDAMVHAAFEQHLVMQTFRPPQIEPALTPTAVPPTLRHSTAADAVDLQCAATPLHELSDGVQVFCGLVASVAALPHLLLLIDEPEAFLHPTLSRRLGANLARIARERHARLFAATHSPDFLLGCLEEVPETTVLRLDYRSNVAASHSLAAEEVANLSREPLLRSANALRALFARSAVVCEADSDRAFYEEINRRLLEASGRTGALDCVFLNAQNWQTTVKIAAPLRAAGVPAAVILDLDTLAVDDSWPEIVAMGQPTRTERDMLLEARSAARDAINACGRPAPDAPLRVKFGGMDALADDQQVPVRDAVDEFATVGVFLVRVGELERWLQQFGCTNKQTWVTDILHRLGTPQDPAYVTPGTGDVWAFMERLAQWAEDPTRHGMPAT
jgi:putative AbiEii toxin of type IV toxin-antitoxin system